MNAIDFATAFETLTGKPPFPWQAALYEQFVSDRPDNIPSSCNLPTGLGKTSVIAIWLIALAKHPKKMPRRLVYVVNRRTVVDQTTDEVEKLLDQLLGEFGPPPPTVYQLRTALAQLSADPNGSPLAISTLRGQFADNREWSADPSRPAVICGTVDMIGSRLLFSGYGVGFKGKPLHAGFLGQDVLLVHDEAHLEPAFQDLLVAIEKEQKRCKEFRAFRVMELSATSWGTGDVFELTKQERDLPEVIPNPPTEPIHYVWQRQKAKKALHPLEIKDEKKLAEEIAALALKHKESDRAVLVFVRKVEDVEKVFSRLPKDAAEKLTGTLRGFERDGLVKKPIFQRFLPASNCDKDVTPAKGTVYLVCTSAGEVGVNISADHLVCDLSTFDSMAQRFGRVNRFGERDDTRIDIVHPSEFDTKDKFDVQREKTLALLKALKGDGSPAALGNLDAAARVAAFAPRPLTLPTSDILFDNWALTTIRGKLPGRPIVEPYLHGIGGWEPPETHVAWREEVERLQPKYQTDDEREERKNGDRKELEKLAALLLDEYPLKPHELLREPSYRAFKQFETIAKRRPNDPAWLLDDDGKVEVLTIAELADKNEKERIEGKIVLLPRSAGGMTAGMLDGTSPLATDVADEIFVDDEQKQRLRVRVDDPNDEQADGMRLIRRIDFAPLDDEDAEGNSWYWFGITNDGDVTATLPVSWCVHVRDVVREATSIVEKLSLDQQLKEAIIFAARFHDHGKRRKQFQTVLGNYNYPAVVLAKSGKKGGRLAERYRHEFGSLLDVQREAEFKILQDKPEQQELILHLIAVHHGRGRPHFPVEEAFDPESKGQDADAIAAEVPRRFARLQRKYGRWGLAYLESILRAADWAASAKPSEFVEDES